MIFRQLQRSAQAKDKTIRELQSRVAELEKELAFADSDVAAKRNYIDDLEREMACARKLDMDQLDQIKALREERDEIKRKAIEQSEYIQSHGLTEYEMERLKARIAELETKCERCGLKVAHEPTPGVTVLESELTFTPGELVYVPATVRYYPSETPGEPDVKEITYP